MGIRNMKKMGGPRMYEKADKCGNIVGLKQQAEATADYLAHDQWGSIKPNANSLWPIEDRPKSQKRNTRTNAYNLTHFSLQGLRCVLNKLKYRKASGPDDIQCELFKWLDNDNLNSVLTVLNCCWTTGTFPRDKLRALVASLYKKGDPKNQGNYRPISLLN